MPTELMKARDEGLLVAPKGLSMIEAYRIADELREALLARGYRLVGRKLGFTNEAIWPELGLTEPIWAPVYDRTVKRSEGVHSLSGAVGARIELEVVLEVESVRPLRVGWAALGFEIVQCHYPEWKFRCADAVADFGLHRALHVGEPSRETGSLEKLAVSLSRDGEPVASGAGKDVLGGPLRALDWLVELLDGEPHAPGLEPGEIVTTGTMTGALPVAPGETWEATVLSGALLGGLTLTFTE